MFSADTVPSPRVPDAAVPLPRATSWTLRSPAGDDRFLPTGRPTGAARPAIAATPAPDGQQASDLELLRRVVEGDHAAFEAFYHRFRNLIVACASRVCQRSGVRLQADDLADLLSEVSLNMVAHDYRRLRLYRTDGGCSVSSWVGVIASSTAHDFLRKERRRRLDPTLDTDLERIANPVDAPDHDLIEREQRQFVDEALRGFSARDRRFMELYFVEALGPEAIADRMKVSVSTVYSKKAKIKTRLRKLAEAAA